MRSIQPARSRPVRVRGIVLFLALLVTLPASANAQVGPARSRTDAALEALKTRGLVPLWLGVDRPVPYPEIQRVLDALAALSLAERDRSLVEGLRVGLPPSLSLDLPYGPMGLSSAHATLAAGGPSLAYTFGWQIWSELSQLRAASMSFSLGTTDILVGRSPVRWGPGAYAGLAYSDYPGGLDLLRVSFQPWPGVRYSKFWGLVDDRVSVVGQRVDILVHPHLRLGIGDAVLMVGSPYWLYLVNPLPPLNALDVGFAIFDKSLHRKRNDNGAITLDFDWVARPGLRFYGELLVDDILFVWPVLISPELAPARWGALLGFHWIDAFPGWGLRFEYTLVPNWTYAAVAGSTHWVARGLPLGHPVGNDFDLWHLRFSRLEPAGLEVWLSYLRKGEGRIDRFWSSPAQARSALFLTGVVEHSLILGFEFSGNTAGWVYTAGPWIAYRTNAGHSPGLTRLDWGVSLAAQLRF